MKPIWMVFLSVLGLFAAPLGAVSESAYAEVASQLEAARVEVQNALPRLAAMAEERPTDVEAQLGLGILYAKYGASQEQAERAEAHWQEVIALDPTNGPVWALLATREILTRSGEYRQRLDDLERLTANAKGRGAKQIIIRRQYSFNAAFIERDGVKTEVMPAQEYEPALYKYLTDGSGNDVIIKDVDYGAARNTLERKLGEELRGAVETVDRAERADPNNALYNYLRAYAYFLLGQDESAMAEVRKGVQKARLNTYFTERRSAVLTILRQGGFSDEFSTRIADVYTPIGDFINRELLKPHLRPLSEQAAKQRNIPQVAEISQMILSMAKQIREEPLPFPSDYNQGLSHFLERWVEEQQHALQDVQSDK